MNLSIGETASLAEIYRRSYAASPEHDLGVRTMSVSLYEKPIVRQIVFNHALEEVMNVDPPDWSYTPILAYLDKSAEARSKTAEELAPFLELLIFVEPPNFSYSVEFLSDAELDEKQWRKIRKCVNDHLREFEANVSPELVGRLFCPHKDDKLEKRVDDLWIRLNAARQLKERYSEVIAELKKMMKAKSLIPSMVAKRFSVDIKEIKKDFYAAAGGRVQPAKIAKNILLASELAPVAGVYTPEELEHDVLYQKLDSLLPNLKKIFESRRALVFDRNSDPMKTPFF
ncbi:MAG: hypothetical protein ABSF90_06190 [Syntrophobacteraceae bacterium]